MGSKMNPRLFEKLSFNDFLIFVDLAERKSLKETIYYFGHSADFVINRIKKLEEVIGSPLFYKGQDKKQNIYPLTKAGELFYEDALDILKKFNASIDKAKRKTYSQENVLTIESGTIFAYYALPAVIVKMREKFPDLMINVIGNNIFKRNIETSPTDIHIYTNQTPKGDFFKKEILRKKICLYGHEKYLEEYGVPKSYEDLKYHKMLGWCHPLPIYANKEELGKISQCQTQEVFATNDSSILFGLLKKGIGLGLFTSFIDGEYKYLKKIHFYKGFYHNYYFCCRNDLVKQKTIKYFLQLFNEY